MINFNFIFSIISIFDSPFERVLNMHPAQAGTISNVLFNAKVSKNKIRESRVENKRENKKREG